ncbi:aldo/keto reductase [Ferroacidibacillus organovorans]|uniref:Aldo/keto reductase n=1 Tax=Ferroacidibacillus organovorans TaxID=1765683 RepID=A0A162S1B4_9BACL|nr:aldo/keto reductase [Ferroacidibacillus organovorans]KYP79431.1 glyoxal reductase [Ferroacidibacillus organovorans]OAG93857.1 glyoxal reductase [Ferroacidibacillus organovorans]OPG15874.1 aldo/keto reductase [Ferroacidibacillus organovorans]
MKNLADCTTLHNGIKMPWVGLGVWQAKDGQEVEQAVRAAIELGYRSIDTAAIYGNEVGVGAAIKDSGAKREDLFITTKVWNARQGYESTLAAFDESMAKLGLEYLDLYLIHWAIAGKYNDTWRALEKLYRDGRVRAIGVSNFQVEHLEDVMKNGTIKPMVNQVEFHPLLTEQPIYDFCKKEGIQMEAWSPLMRGGELLTKPVIVELSEKYGKTPAQIVLRWDLEKGVVTIPKSVHRERIAENANLFDFSLTADEVARIDALNENKRSFEYDPYNVNF